jgi:hypothetical protein
VILGSAVVGLESQAGHERLAACPFDDAYSRRTSRAGLSSRSAMNLVCHTPILTQQQLTDFDDEQGHSWSAPKRLWPATGLPEMGAIPDAVRHALQEADRAMYGEAMARAS